MENLSFGQRERDTDQESTIRIITVDVDGWMEELKLKSGTTRRIIVIVSVVVTGGCARFVDVDRSAGARHRNRILQMQLAKPRRTFVDNWIRGWPGTEYSAAFMSR
jgi:Fe-S cluster assembly ATPase SufC